MILVVGGAGYLGSEVVKALGNECVVYDALLYRDEYRAPVDHFVRGDVRDHYLLDTELARADCVVWLVAIVGDAPCLVNPALSVAVNAEAVAHLAAAYDGPIVFTSTASVYGYHEGQADEDTPVNPLSIYAETKLAAETALLAAGKRAAILRLGTLHGLSDRMRFDLLVNQFTLQASTTKTLKVMGGTQMRPLLAVQDAARFIAGLAREPDWRPGIYNVATGNYTVLDVAALVADYFCGVEINMLPGMDDARSYALNSQRAMRDLEFATWRHVWDSVGDIGALLRQGRFRNPYAPRYYNLRALQGGIHGGNGTISY